MSGFEKHKDTGMPRVTLKHGLLFMAACGLLFLLPSLSQASFFASFVRSFQSNIMQENRYLLILDGLKTTIIISVFSTLFGTLLGALVCFMRMSRNRAMSLIAKAYISVLRGTPVLVFLMLMHLFLRQ